MVNYRENCLVIDFNVLPACPDIETIKNFLVEQVKLDLSQVKNLQISTSMNQVFIEMMIPDEAVQIARNHNAKHFVVSEKKKFFIPLYVEDGATTVKVHDLPPTMPNNLVAAQFEKFGRVVSIRDEVWREFFPGVPNGVRVIRINLVKPIPSFLMIEGVLAYTVYINQIKTCRHCSRKLHPGQKCNTTMKIEPNSNSTKNDNSTNTQLDAEQQKKIIERARKPSPLEKEKNKNQNPKPGIDTSNKQGNPRQITKEFIPTKISTNTDTIDYDSWLEGWRLQHPKKKHINNSFCKPYIFHT